MKELIIAKYLVLEDFVDDLIRLEHVIEQWEGDHPGYKAGLVAEVDEMEIYSITVSCKRPSKA